MISVDFGGAGGGEDAADDVGEAFSVISIEFGGAEGDNEAVFEGGVGEEASEGEGDDEEVVDAYAGAARDFSMIFFV